MNTTTPLWNITHRENGIVGTLPNVIRANRANLFFGSHGAKTDFDICAEYIGRALPEELKESLALHIWVEHGLPKGAPTEVNGLQKHYQSYCAHFKQQPQINWGSLLNPNGQSTKIPEEFADYYSALNQIGVREFEHWFKSKSGGNEGYSAATLAERDFFQSLKEGGWSIRNSVEQPPAASALAHYRSQIAFKKAGEEINNGDLRRAIKCLVRQAELEILRDELRDNEYARLIARNMKQNEAVIVVRGSAHQGRLSQELSRQEVSWASSTFLDNSRITVTLRDVLKAAALTEFSDEFLPHAYRWMAHSLLSNLIESTDPHAKKDEVNQTVTRALLSLDVATFSNWFEGAERQRRTGLSNMAIFTAEWTLGTLGDRAAPLREMFVQAGLIQTDQ